MIKKILIITSCILALLVVVAFFSLDYIGDLIFESIIEAEYTNINDLDDLVDSQLEDLDTIIDEKIDENIANVENSEKSDKFTLSDNSNLNSNNNATLTNNVDVSNNEESINESSSIKESQVTKKNSSTDKDSKTNKIIETSTKTENKPKPSKEEVNTSTSNNTMNSNNADVIPPIFEDVNQNDENFNNLKEFEEVKKIIEEEENVVDSVDKLYEADAIKSVKDSVATKDKLFVATKVITKLSKDQLGSLINMLSGGITLDEKISAIKIVNQSFDSEQIEEIKRIYHKYVDQLEVEN